MPAGKNNVYPIAVLQPASEVCPEIAGHKPYNCSSRSYSDFAAYIIVGGQGCTAVRGGNHRSMRKLSFLELGIEYLKCSFRCNEALGKGNVERECRPFAYQHG